MTGSQKRQMRQRFCAHLYPVKTFRGDPTRPAYTLYSLWDYPTYLAAENELDELVTQWPQNRQRTVALLAVRRAFFDNGATHWAEQLVWDEKQVNIHALMLHERRRARWHDPALEMRYAQNLALAEEALVESQRRKQGPPTGTAQLPAHRGRVKIVRLPQSRSRPPKDKILLALQQIDVLIQEARLSPQTLR